MTRPLSIVLIVAGVPLIVHAAEGNLNAADQQKASVAAMAESIARQQASIQRQIGATQGNAFFLSPPPEHSIAPLQPSCPPLSEAEVTSLITDASQREQLDPDLLRSVMLQESAFRPCAVSSKGATGLMQLMPETASHFNVVDPFDPPSNVNAGAKLLKQLLGRYKGDVALALGAYNAGAGAVDAVNGVPNIPETVNYVNRILGMLPNPNLNTANGSSTFTSSTLSQGNPYDFLEAIQPLLPVQIPYLDR